MIPAAWVDDVQRRVDRARAFREGVEAYWLTNFSTKRVGSLALYRMAKSWWQIENRFFSEGKTLYGLDHTAHDQADAVVADTLLLCLTLALERLYRLRYLHRGSHRIYTAAELHLRFWLALSAPAPPDTSKSPSSVSLPATRVRGTSPRRPASFTFALFQTPRT